MSGWPLAILGYPDRDVYDAATTSTPTVAVTSGGTTHTKGSWVEIEASTSIDIRGLGVVMNGVNVSATDTSTMLDIGIGAAGSEVVLIPNIICGYVSSATMTISISLPAGTRIAARSQAVIVSDVVNVAVKLYNRTNSFVDDVRQFGNVVTYGANTATSRGVYYTFESGSTAHTLGPWTEVTASTTQLHSAIAMSVAGTNTSLTSQLFLVDVGVGAAGSEEVILSQVLGQMTTAEIVNLSHNALVQAIAADVPIGSRLAVRAQFGATTNELFSICLHGVT